MVDKDHSMSDVCNSRRGHKGTEGNSQQLQKNTAFQHKNLTPSVKHGGGRIMVWACIAAFGPGWLAINDGTMNSELHQRIRTSVRELNLMRTWCTGILRSKLPLLIPLLYVIVTQSTVIVAMQLFTSLDALIMNLI